MLSSLATSSRKFTYQRVRSTIADMLRDGEWSAGDRLPPIRELAERFGCNYHTVRKGLESLIRDAYLESRNGSGVYVRDTTPRTPVFIPPATVRDTLLAVVCHPTLTPTDTRFIASLHAVAERQGLHLALHTATSFSRPEKIFDRVAARGCAALLLPLLRSDDPVDEIAACIGRYPFPFVVGTPFPGLERYCYETAAVFGLSTRRAVELSFRYLRALGYDAPLLVLPADAPTRSVVDHLDPYIALCARSGWPAGLELSERLPGALEALLAKHAARRGQLAAVCFDDDLAARLVDAAARAGWRVPEDLAVIGLGDTDVAVRTSPPLTSIAFPYDYVTGAMVECALALREGRSAQRSAPVWQELVVRRSCGGMERLGSGETARLLASLRRDIEGPGREETA